MKENCLFLHGDYEKLLIDVQADLILTSPPYNIGSKSVRIDGYRTDGLYDPKSYGAIRDYPDNMSESKYQSKQKKFLKWAAKHINKNGILAYNHKPRRKNNKMIHPLEWIIKVPELTLMEEIIWDRGSTHNHSNRLIWPHTERIYILRRTDGKYSFLNKASLSFRSDIWRINPSKPNGHNAPFPEKLVENIIEAWSLPGQLVVDPYCGSGTTGIVACNLGRKFIGTEILKKYYDIAIGRIGHRKVA